MRESTFQNRIIRKLKKKPECWYVKIWAGGFQKAGIPDLLICYKGHFIAVELKNEVGKPSELQLVNIDLISKAGGSAFILSPLNEKQLWNLFDEIDRRTTNNS